MRTLGNAAVLITAILLAGAAHADVVVSQHVESGPVGVADPFQVTVDVEGAQGAVRAELPPGDFQLLGRSQSTNVQMTSGPSGNQTRRTERFTFRVAATHPGTVTIPAATVSADGEQAGGQSSEVEVQPGHVARRATAPSDDGDEDDADSDPFASMQSQLKRMGFNDPFFQRMMGSDPFSDAIRTLGPPVEVHPGDVRLIAVPESKRTLMGQQLTLSYYLVTRVPLSGASDLQLPAIEGAATHDIDLGKRPSVEQRGTESWVLLARKALFANAPGRLLVPAASVNVTVEGYGLPVAARSAPVSIAVDGLPPDATGAAVGQWTQELRGPASARANEPATIRVTVSGTGDLDSLPAPVLHTPSEWKVFPPTSSEQAASHHGELGGSRTWEYVALPNREGDASLSVEPLPTFDPETRHLASARSTPLELQILPAPIVPPSPASPAPLASPARSPALSGSLALLGLVIVILLGSVVVLARRLHAGAPADPRQRLRQAAQRKLVEAHHLFGAGQGPAFFGAISDALETLVAALVGGPVSPAERPTRLQQAGVAAAERDAITRAFESCSRATFLRSTDVVAMERTLVLADRAFDGAA